MKWAELSQLWCGSQAATSRETGFLSHPRTSTQSNREPSHRLHGLWHSFKFGFSWKTEQNLSRTQWDIASHEGAIGWGKMRIPNQRRTGMCVFPSPGRCSVNDPWCWLPPVITCTCGMMAWGKSAGPWWFTHSFNNYLFKSVSVRLETKLNNKETTKYSGF